MSSEEKRFYFQTLHVTPGKHSYSQTAYADKIKGQLSGLPDPEGVIPLIHFTYGQAGIQQRHVEMSFEETEARSDWYRMVNEALVSLATRCLREVQEKNPRVTSCDGLVVLSGTHCGFPSLSRKIQSALGFSDRTLCFDLAGHGCAGVPHGLFLGQTLIETGRCRNVCVLTVDVMGTSARSRRFTRAPLMSELVAYLLPSDGAAAVILSRSPGERPVLSYRESDLQTKMWPDSLGWNVLSADEDNQPLHFVGREVRYRAPEELSELLDEEAIRGPIVMHPGGLALLRQVEKKFPDIKPATKLSGAVMQSHGNLNAATLLWVLREALIQKYSLQPSARLVAIGPGKVTAVLHLRDTETHAKDFA